MYLWNTKALAMKLKNGELKQSDRFTYFIVFIILIALISEVSFYTTEDLTVITITDSIISIIITVIGTLISYKINKNGDDREFIDRYICISIPITFKLISLSMVCYTFYLIGCYLILGNEFDKYLDTTTWIDVIIYQVFGLLFYWRMIHHISG